jgi:hypothetical protein
MVRYVVVAVFAILALSGGCSAPDSDLPGSPSARPRGEPASSATRDLAFPSDTVQDWVSYADRVVAVEITGEGRRPPSEEEIALGRVSRFRMVTWQRRRVLWANPARPEEDPPATGSTYGGSYASDRDEGEVEAFGGDPVLVVGHTYLAVLTHTALGGDVGLPREWLPVAMLPFDDDLVGDGERYRGWTGQEELLSAVWGRTGAQVTELLVSTPVDPKVRPYAEQDAARKYQLASRRR